MLSLLASKFPWLNQLCSMVQTHKLKEREKWSHSSIWFWKKFNTAFYFFLTISLNKEMVIGFKGRWVFCKLNNAKLQKSIKPFMTKPLAISTTFWLILGPICYTIHTWTQTVDMYKNYLVPCFNYAVKGNTMFADKIFTQQKTMSDITWKNQSTI